MSTTVDATVLEVQRILQEKDAADPVVPVDVVRKTVIRTASLLTSTEHLDVGTSWVLAALPLVAGTADYELATDVEYQSVLDFRYVSDNEPLIKYSEDMVLSLREGSTPSTGRPRFVSLRRDADTHLQVMVWPTPTVSENVKALITAIPSESAAIYFSSRACHALQLMSAERVGRTLSDSNIKALDLNPRAFDAWAREAAELERVEKLAVHRLQRERVDWLDYWRNT